MALCHRIPVRPITVNDKLKAICRKFCQNSNQCVSKRIQNSSQKWYNQYDIKLIAFGDKRLHKTKLGLELVANSYLNNDWLVKYTNNTSITEYYRLWIRPKLCAYQWNKRQNHNYMWDESKRSSLRVSLEPIDRYSNSDFELI